MIPKADARYKDMLIKQYDYHESEIKKYNKYINSLKAKQRVIEDKIYKLRWKCLRKKEKLINIVGTANIDPLLIEIECV